MEVEVGGIGVEVGGGVGVVGVVEGVGEGV